MGGTDFHMIGMVRDAGGDYDVAAIMYFPAGIIGGFGALLTGRMVDRGYKHSTLFAVALGLCATQNFVLANAESAAMGYAYGVLRGLTTGLLQPIRGTIYAQYYGRKHLGSIMSVDKVLAIAGTGLGPLVYGIGEAWSGGFAIPLYVTGCLPAMAAILALFCMRPPSEAERNGCGYCNGNQDSGGEHEAVNAEEGYGVVGGGTIGGANAPPGGGSPGRPRKVR